jgi:hypothetical protein
MKKTMTEKQLAANRRNAQRSTGPRTDAGKAVSRCNALKHGLLAKDVVVRDGWLTGESEREFRRLQREFMAVFAPANRMEAELVDRMVAAQWRAYRVRRVETAEATLNVMRKEQGHRLKDHSAKASVLHRYAPEKFFLWLNHTTDGLWLTRSVVEDCRARVEAAGALTGEVLEDLRKRLLPGHPVERKLKALLDEGLQIPSGPEAEPRRREHKAAVLALLDKELESLGCRVEASISRDVKEEDQELTAALLPHREKLDLLMRYEAASDRQFYQAMHQLERLQRRRMGEAVPVPFTVEVTGGKEQAA